MRWRLILSTSIFASICGGVLTLLLFYLLFGSSFTSMKPAIMLSLAGILPATIVLIASVFVYRHTARRRSTQAWLTAVITVFLMLSILLAGLFFARSRLRRGIIANSHHEAYPYISGVKDQTPRKLVPDQLLVVRDEVR
jgi:branched-subunit amino acid ABC-type transport system permease component